MFREVEPYLEPIDIFDKIGERKTELSDVDLGFICGLIKEKRPNKIVEVGVSAGGTSCVILNCLEKLNLESEFYSVDISYTYHFNPSKKCGYQIEDGAKYLNYVDKHKLLLGKSIAQVLESEIGSDIDMLILDTIHYLPGELLDFLVCLPFLSQHAVVILDDLNFAHRGENTNAIATKVLFDLIVGAKTFPKNVIYPKMGGVFLNEDTRKYSLDYFLGLMTPWWYELRQEEIRDYRSIIKKQYGRDMVLLFDEAVEINNDTLKRKKQIKTEIDKLIYICKNQEKILIYGVGQRGSALGIFLKERTGVNIEYIVSDDINKEDFTKKDIKVSQLKEISEQNDNSMILVAVAGEEVRENLARYNMQYLDVPNYVFPFIKDYVRVLHGNDL